MPANFEGHAVRCVTEILVLFLLMFRETGARCVRGWEHSVVIACTAGGSANVRDSVLDVCRV